MNIYKISQDENTGYDTYDSAIVIAETEEEAKKIHPNGRSEIELHEYEYEYKDYSWASTPEQVKVHLVGKALGGRLPGVLLASFNAG